jgi:hypothetical protein
MPPLRVALLETVMHISTTTTTTISPCGYEPVVVHEPQHIVEIVLDAARLIMLHNEGSKVQAVQFLRQSLHLPRQPDQEERPIYIADALHLVHDLREADMRQNSYAPIRDEDIEF